MNSAIVSIFGPSRRIHLWLDFYEKLNQNDVPFEIVFAGPNNPNFELPYNFKYIYSEVKPAQCANIAYLNIYWTICFKFSDDFVFSDI